MLFGILFSTASYAQIEADDCLSEAVESAIAFKIDKLADGDCSSLDISEFKQIEEDRQSKKRFLKNALQGMHSGVKIPSRLFLSFDDSAADVDLDKSNVCGVVQKKSAQASKEIMKDCPDGAEMFQLIIGKQQDPDKVSEISLAHACEKVQKLKALACRESKIVHKSFSSDKSETTDNSSPVSKGSATGNRVKAQ